MGILRNWPQELVEILRQKSGLDEVTTHRRIIWLL